MHIPYHKPHSDKFCGLVKHEFKYFSSTKVKFQYIPVLKKIPVPFQYVLKFQYAVSTLLVLRDNEFQTIGADMLKARRSKLVLEGG